MMKQQASASLVEKIMTKFARLTGLSRSLQEELTKMENRAKYFEEWELGEVHESASRTVTETDIGIFSGLSGDYNPLHTDEEFAKKGIFGTRVAHGYLVLSISSGLIYQTGYFEGVLEAFLGMKEFRITKGVFPGDTIKKRFEVVGKRETKQGKGIITFKMDVLNQRNEICQERLTTAMFKRKTMEPNPD